MALAAKRQAIRHLLDEQDPADALAAYYALYHPDHKSALILYPEEAARAEGYMAVSRTGIDLFRPLITLRLPPGDPEAAADLIYRGPPVGTAVLINCPEAYYPLMQAFFTVQTAQPLRLYALDPNRFEPIVNVLVVEAESANEWPRFIIRQPSPAGGGEVVASAGLNWQSPNFAEIAVRTSTSHRRQGWGRSVVAAMVRHLLENGRTPLYVVAEDNEPSIRLAERMGFTDTGARRMMLEAVLHPRP